jgi:hypothetical protein
VALVKLAGRSGITVAQAGDELRVVGVQSGHRWQRPWTELMTCIAATALESSIYGKY